MSIKAMATESKLDFSSAARSQMHPSWQAALLGQFKLDYMQRLQQFINAEAASGKVIYPPADDLFSAFNLTSLDQVKVVIIGQDPYHGPAQAHGLCFSVKQGIKPPPSLANIYKELKADLNISIPPHGLLSSWAKQGVLLLNAVLTVEGALAGSHQKRGWENFTDHVIEVLNAKRDKLVFILWGAYAQKKGAKIDRSRHYVIESAHPSPLSAHRGFLGSKPFSKANTYLSSQAILPIDWSVPGAP